MSVTTDRDQEFLLAAVRRIADDVAALHAIGSGLLMIAKEV